MRKLTRTHKRILAALLIALVGFGWGWMLWQLNLGQGLRTASFDLPFRFARHVPPPEVVMVYLDEESQRELGQPLSEALDRRIHAELIERLRRQGARTLVFDILFHDERPGQDEMLGEAIGNHGQVVLAGERVRNQAEMASTESLLIPAPSLRRAGASWGLTVVPIDVDGVVRRVQYLIPTTFGDKPSLSLAAWRGGADRSPPTGTEATLLSFYGPAGTFPAYSLAGVLLDRGIPADAFRDKVVVVGARQQASLLMAGKDVFPTPYLYEEVAGPGGRSERRLTPGMEIQATAIANLIEGRHIRSLSDAREPVRFGIAAVVLATATCLLPPIRGFLLALGLAAGVMVLAVVLQWRDGIHFLWTIPALGQFPLVAALALGAHYWIEYAARWKLRRAFKSYMSDEQARQIDEDEVSLELGGKEVEATILFSDLAGFTSMSEGLPPESVSKALIRYFERATEGILDNHGTIIKYVGDAVMATWGAPLKVDREADRAIDAAIQMQLASAEPILLETPQGPVEEVLETRVGINHGLGLAGNLGSRRRFDYSVIGDTTNTAARLEGLNKMLGTSILVSAAVLDECVEPGRFLLRRMGSYVLKGKTRGIVVHEVIGTPESPIRRRSEAYLENYRCGLAAFESGDWELARRHLAKSLVDHDRLDEDPASRLILEAIEEVAGGEAPKDWRGEIVLRSK